MPRMPREEERRILDGYAAWDPRTSSTEDLLESLKVTRATLYNVLQRNGVTPKTRRQQAAHLADAPPLSEGALQTLMKVAVEDLYQARVAAERSAEFVTRAFDELVDAVRENLNKHPRTKQSDELRRIVNRAAGSVSGFLGE